MNVVTCSVYVSGGRKILGRRASFPCEIDVLGHFVQVSCEVRESSLVSTDASSLGHCRSAGSKGQCPLVVVLRSRKSQIEVALKAAVLE